LDAANRESAERAGIPHPPAGGTTCAGELAQPKTSPRSDDDLTLTGQVLGDAVGVTGMMNAVVALIARPLGTVQVTVWPAAVQPAGSVPMVRPVGIVSVIVAVAVVAAVPVFWTLSV
jgi:hypothetical protein